MGHSIKRKASLFLMFALIVVVFLGWFFFVTKKMNYSMLFPFVFYSAFLGLHIIFSSRSTQGAIVLFFVKNCFIWAVVGSLLWVLIAFAVPHERIRIINVWEMNELYHFIVGQLLISSLLTGHFLLGGILALINRQWGGND